MAFLITMLLVAVCAIVVIAQAKAEDSALKSSTDQQLINEYLDIVEKIQSRSGIDFRGATAGHFARKMNEEIGKYQDRGKTIATELTSRGYKVNTNLLKAVPAGKAGAKGDILKGAIVGGIIAGAPGAVIGAMHENNKNKK